MTFIQTGQYYVGSVIDLKGASNNTITNVSINGYGASNYAVSITNSTSPQAASSNNTISNCSISTSVLIPNTWNCGNGIGLLGSSTLAGDNNKIENNTITNFVYYHIIVNGKYTNTQVSGNNVYNTAGTSWHNTYSAVNISTATGGGTTSVFNNKIHDILTQTNYSAGGIPAIYSNGATGTTTNIYNNEISLDIAYNPLVTRFGIQTNNSGAVNIYYNSIYIGGTAVTEGNSYGLYRGGTGTTNILNNAVFNARSNGTGTGKHYGIYATSTASLTSNYNDIFVNGTGGVFGFNVSDRLTLADWQTATSKDLNSVSGDPGFTSTTNLQPDLTNINVMNLDGKGTPIASIATDILGNPRSTSLPVPTDIGAYEFTSNFTFTISGNAGIAGATLSWFDGTDKTTTADVSGNYALTVPSGWSGTVTPAKTGYNFNPVNIPYTNVTANLTAQNYAATPIVYTISGSTGTAGVTLSWTDGTPKTTTSDGSGNYSFTVSYNWSGIITPELAGFTFTPANISLSNVLANTPGQDFAANPILYTISGNAGIAGATLSWDDGVPKTATADGAGLYSFTVSYNWSGTVTPSFTGYSFTPVNRIYTNVLTDQTAQNYTTAPITYTISGNAGLSGVILYYTDGTPKTATADGSGNYSFTVSYSWSGTVTPALAGYSFTPTNRTYTNVLSDKTVQDYTATPSSFIILGNAGTSYATISWFDGTAKTTTTTVDGDYFINVSYNWSGSVTPSKAGFTFNPTENTYSNVNGNFINQDFAAIPIVYTISGNTGTGGVTLSWADVAMKPAINKTQGKLKSGKNQVVNESISQGKGKSKEDITTLVKNILNQKQEPIPLAPNVDKTIVSNPDGSYSFTVSWNWTGTVAPTLAGFTFTPASIAYTNVLADQANQDYAADSIKFTISGNAGIAGATLSWVDGTPKSTVADGTGAYSFTVSYNWSGTVSPYFAGYSFSPAVINYANLVADQPNQDYTVLPLPNSILGFWKLDATVSGYYVDQTGINPGTGTTTPIVGLVNGGQQFNGTTNKIDVPANPSLDFAANSNFSFEFWYNAPSSTPATNRYVARRYISSQTYWAVYIGPDKKVRFIMNSGGIYAVATGNIIVDDNNWHHIAATRNGLTGDMKIYIDGNLSGSANHLFTVDFSSPTAALNIGYTANNFFLTGILDEVAVHNTELSSAKILSHYNNGSLGYYAPAAPVITTTPLTIGTSGSLYTYDVDATGYPAPTYSLTTFPVGMTIDPNTGVISWTPSASGNNDVTVKASNGVNPDATQSFTIVVSDPLVLPADLVAYLKLDATVSGYYVDQTGINPGTGTTTPIVGLVNGGQQFNGTTNKIDVPANPSLDFAANSNFSFEFWYNAPSSTPATNRYVARRYISSQTYWAVYIGPDKKVRFIMNSGGIYAVATGNIIVDDNNWHHIAATRNGLTGDMKIYIDGNLSGSANHLFTVDFSSPTAALNIGYTANNFFLTGILDEVAVHNTELSSAKILSHYNNGSLGYYAPAAPVITTTPLTIGTSGSLYTYDVDATGYPAPTYSLTTFPVGMTIDPNTGVISWTPSASGNNDVTVKASNGVNPDATQSFTIKVTIIPTGMISYWQLNEVSGGSYTDLMNVNPGTGTTTPIVGLVNGGQQFNGTTNKIDVPANPSLDFAANSNFSFEFWYNAPSSTPATNRYVARRYISSQTYWAVYIGPDKKVRFIMNSGGIYAVATGNIIVDDNNWHHIAATRNGLTGDMKIYIDGNLSGSANHLFTVDFSSPTAALNIGYTANNFFLTGILDEVALYNIELSQAQVIADRDKGLAGTPLAKKNVLATNPVFERFDALSSNNKISLNWITKTETPGVFEVNRTKTGENEWVKIGSVPSSGTKDFQFKDESLSGEGKYSYMIKYIGKDGGYANSEISEVELLPVTYNLYQNYPNPFNPSTTIKYQIPYNSTVSVIVYSAIGEKVAELVNGVQAAGTYNYVWNAGRFASGVYILRLQANGTNGEESFTKILKLMLVK